MAPRPCWPSSLNCGRPSRPWGCGSAGIPRGGRCHRRIDLYGFAQEEFDAIGRHRTTAAAGEPLDTRATLPDGMTLDGQQSLRAYLLGPRREQLVRVFGRKLLGYALGRGGCR